MTNPIMEMQATVTEFANSTDTYSDQLDRTLRQVATWVSQHPNERILDINYEVQVDSSCHIYVYHTSKIDLTTSPKD
ncbi:MAG: hypothetical protein WC479_04565 [Candidatus Izemoplasmatales bacterium]